MGTLVSIDFWNNLTTKLEYAYRSVWPSLYWLPALPRHTITCNYLSFSKTNKDYYLPLWQTVQYEIFLHIIYAYFNLITHFMVHICFHGPSVDHTYFHFFFVKFHLRVSYTVTMWQRTWFFTCTTLFCSSETCSTFGHQSKTRSARLQLYQHEYCNITVLIFLNIANHFSYITNTTNTRCLPPPS